MTAMSLMIHEGSCRDLGKRCRWRLVVMIYTVHAPLVKVTSCSRHVMQWIWEIRDKVPGHTGIRTRRINERDQQVHGR